MSGLKFVLISFLVWRLFLFLPLFVSEQVLSYRQGYDYTNIWKFAKPYEPVLNFLLYPWANFDGVHYLSIAGNGYNKENLGFFPLFPAAIKILSAIFDSEQTFGAGQFFSGFLIANITFLAALLVLYKLINLDYSEKTARLAILFTLFFPTSFFFASIYSEGLFLLLVLCAFYFIRRKQTSISSLFGFLAAITRLIGIAILPAIIYEIFEQEKRIKKWLTSILPLLIVLSGLVGYAYFNWVKAGDALSFIKAHGNIGTSRSVENIVLIPQTLFRYIKILLNLPYSQYEWWIALLELATFVFVVALLFVAWKKKIRTSYLIFSLFAFLIPVSSGTFTGLPRYVLVLFPIFIALALIKSRWIQIAYVVISTVLLFILLMSFSKGYFIA